jgi:hypothetical protein
MSYPTILGRSEWPNAVITPAEVKAAQAKNSRIIPTPTKWERTVRFFPAAITEWTNNLQLLPA